MIGRVSWLPNMLVAPTAVNCSKVQPLLNEPTRQDTDKLIPLV
jgi:hypothetical protein